MNVNNSPELQIVNYQPEFRQHFKQLNEEWIKRWFTMEAADFKILEHPEESILNNGGHILFALFDGEPIGTCALIKTDDEAFELAKMAVSETARGKGIGLLLGNDAINLAKSKGAKRLYLETNSLLKPAINLYRKLGFQEITGKPSPYARADIQMELDLTVRLRPTNL